MAVAKKDPNTYSSQTNGELKMIFKDKQTVRRKKTRTKKLQNVPFKFSIFLVLVFFFSFIQMGRNADEGTNKLTTQRVKTHGLNT